MLHLNADVIASYKESYRSQAVKPDPKIMHTPVFCVNAKGGLCDRCVRACPAGAVSLGEGGMPVIDERLCTMCGICLGICDAFTSNDITMTDLASRVRRTAQRGEGVFITCPENVRDDDEVAPCVVTVPCLAALSPEFWTLVLAEGVDVTIACDLSRCAECPRGGGIAEMLYAHAIETAQRWAGREISIVDEVPGKTGYLQAFAQRGEVDRRGVFARFAANVNDAASGEYRRRNSAVLQDFYERRERMRAQMRQSRTTFDDDAARPLNSARRRIMMPKRRMLLDAIERDGRIADRVSLLLSDTDCDRCCNQLACADACPTSARRADAKAGLLEYDVRYCIGCGNCERACRQGAVSLSQVPASLLDAQPGIVCMQAYERWLEEDEARSAEKLRASLDPADRLAEAE